MDKSPDAFRTISEVATDLDLPQHVLRFWETRFNQIKPLKRGGGRRYYRPDDVELLRGIRHLLYGEGYTIKGVQRIFREQGVKFVMQAWQEGAVIADAGPVADEADDVPQAPKTKPAKAGKASAPPAASSQKTDLELPDEPIPRDLRVGDDDGKDSAAGMAGRLMGKLRGERTDDDTGDGRLSRDDVRRLQATLFELLEIKRLLDGAR